MRAWLVSTGVGEGMALCLFQSEFVSVKKMTAFAAYAQVDSLTYPHMTVTTYFSGEGAIILDFQVAECGASETLDDENLTHYLTVAGLAFEKVLRAHSESNFVAGAAFAGLDGHADGTLTWQAYGDSVRLDGLNCSPEKIHRWRTDEPRDEKVPWMMIKLQG